MPKNHPISPKGQRGGLHWLARVVMGAALATLPLQTAQAGGVASLVEWDAPEGCLGAHDMYDRLTRVLGREPETLGKLSRVRGTLVRTASGYRLVLETFERDRRSSRLLEAASCDDLVDAAALAVALAIAPESTTALAAPPALPADDGITTKGGAATPTTSMDGAPEGSSARPEATRVRGFASADAVVEYGALPRLTPGLAVAAGVNVGRASLGAYGILLSSQTLDVAPDQRVEFELLLAGVRGCYALLASTPRVAACAGFETGRLRALGLDLAQAKLVQDLWLASGVALDVRWPLSSALAVELRAEPMLPLLRKQYTINGNEDVHAPAVVSSRVYLGLTFSGG